MVQNKIFNEIYSSQTNVQWNFPTWLKWIFKYLKSLYVFVFPLLYSSLHFVGTVASTIDTTKNVASSAVDKGFSLVGSAKGITVTSFYFS